MKQFLFVLSMALLMSCICPKELTVPKGYKTCSADWDCPTGTYCGFVDVDTYAVCKQ